MYLDLHVSTYLDNIGKILEDRIIKAKEKYSITIRNEE